MKLSRDELFHRYKLPAESRICIFCSGDYGKRLYLMLKFNGIAVDMFSDNARKKWNTEIVKGVKCVSPDSLRKYKDAILVIVALKNMTQNSCHNIVGVKLQAGVVIPMSDLEAELSGGILELALDKGVDLVECMATTGIGTDECLERGCLPVQVHYYQPIPNLKDLERRKIWEQASSLPGLRWEPETYLNNLKELSRYYPDPSWAVSSTGNEYEFNLDNNSFSYMCASILYSMICKIQRLPAKAGRFDYG